MGIKAAFDRFEVWVEGWPSAVLTVALLLAALFIVLVAIRGKGWEKAAVAAWVLFP